MHRAHTAVKVTAAATTRTPSMTSRVAMGSTFSTNSPGRTIVWRTAGPTAAVARNRKNAWGSGCRGNRPARRQGDEPQSLREARLNAAPSRRENNCSPADPSGRQSLSVTRPLPLRGGAMTRAATLEAGMRDTAT